MGSRSDASTFPEPGPCSISAPQYRSRKGWIGRSPGISKAVLPALWLPNERGPRMAATQDDRVIAEKRQQRIVQLEEELRQTRQQLDDALHREEMLRFHWRWRWRQRLRRLIGVRLGVMRQYRPRPLSIPERYSRTTSTGGISIAVVTPSYNQAAFLERTMQSVLGQQFPLLEYVVQDGGSLDETGAILDHYRSQLTHCESARDRGQGHAINLGFRHTSAEIMAYLNSDDMLLPGALHY